MHPSIARERAAIGLLTLLGVALAGAVLFDVLQDWLVQGTSLRSTLVENVVPLALALAIPVAAGRLAASDRDASSLVVATKCAVAGFAATLLVAGWVIGLQLEQGQLKPWTIVVQMTIFGTAGGLLLGTTVWRADRRREQLRDVESRYDALTEAFPDYAFIYDTDGEYLDAILGWERGGGRTHTADDLVGETVHDVLSPEPADTILDAVREAAETGSIETVEYRIETARGGRWFEGRATPIAEPVDGEEAVIFAARDVTRQHELRAELEAQNERLDRFASMVSHDLRNPLSVAEGHLELVEADVDTNADGNEHLRKIGDALDRMEAIIEDTLVLARQGQTVSEPEPVDVSTVAPLCWETVDTAAAELEVVEPFEIRADEDRLRHLLENLFRNAVEHGGEDVSVRVGPIDDDGFYVADDGTGLPPADRETLFEHGYTTRSGGTGFGLTIVREIAQAHGWTVDVTESQRGGSRFEFTDVDVAR
ncbi:sensor histidine kinase [Haloparvum sp. PAK95]|uniref:sensor histidine kinase n=1 Tax=Haloparvum sp. PAK95 TaxID=3418962 RepID=UPI003D2F4612